MADEVFIAMALLHRENPDRQDFTVQEIVARARKEGLHPELRPGVQVHASLHCVANKPANPGGYRMLFGTGASRRRLLLQRDPVDPSRKGKIFPEPDEIPKEYDDLLRWAKDRYEQGTSIPTDLSRLFLLRGMGRGLWKPGEADEYVANLRKDWD